MISFEEFQKVELRVAKILAAERVEGSDKLLKLQVEAGKPAEARALAGDGTEGEADQPVLRQIIAGIGKFYEPESLIGKTIVVVANLPPREIMGLISNGMLLASKDENGLALIVPDREIKPGIRVG